MPEYYPGIFLYKYCFRIILCYFFYYDCIPTLPVQLASEYLLLMAITLLLFNKNQKIQNLKK